MVAEIPSQSRLKSLANLNRGGTFKGAGRPKGLRSLVLDKTDNGQKLVEKMCSFAFGKKVPKFLQLKATEWLADRGFGKAVESLVVTDAGSLYSDVLLAMAQAQARGDVEGEDSGQSVSKEPSKIVEVQEIRDFEGSSSGLQPNEQSKQGNQNVL